MVASGLGSVGEHASGKENHRDLAPVAGPQCRVLRASMRAGSVGRVNTAHPRLETRQGVGCRRAKRVAPNTSRGIAKLHPPAAILRRECGNSRHARGPRRLPQASWFIAKPNGRESGMVLGSPFSSEGSRSGDHNPLRRIGRALRLRACIQLSLRGVPLAPILPLDPPPRLRAKWREYQREKAGPRSGRIVMGHARRDRGSRSAD